MNDVDFSDGNSIIHKIDTRIKLISSIIYSFFVALTHKTIILIIYLFISIILVLVGKLSLRKTLKKLIAPNTFILFLVFFIPFSISGIKIFSIWKLDITKEGLVYAFNLLLRCNAIMLSLK